MSFSQPFISEDASSQTAVPRAASQWLHQMATAELSWVGAGWDWMGWDWIGLYVGEGEQLEPPVLFVSRCLLAATVSELLVVHIR